MFFQKFWVVYLHFSANKIKAYHINNLVNVLVKLKWNEPIDSVNLKFFQHLFNSMTFCIIH